MLQAQESNVYRHYLASTVERDGTTLKCQNMHATTKAHALFAFYFCFL